MSEVKAVKIVVPKELHAEIKELVESGRYRSVADFFYVAGQKELDRVKAAEKIREWERMQERCDCEILSDAEVLPK